MSAQTPRSDVTARTTPAQPTAADRIDPAWLRSAVGAVFVAEGYSPNAAGIVAANLVDADLAGVPSHGVMLLPMYIDRIRAGSVSRFEEGEVIADAGAIAVLDGRHALGQLTGVQAMSLAVERARQLGVGAVAVRHAFHFGRAASFAIAAADQGCIGIAMSNTRPLMPAIGGTDAVVGNNPMAIAAPGRDHSVVLDMAMSQTALGKIRLAAAEGRSIPDDWATDAQGLPTTDAAAAIAGLLLPAAGAKGFGLALVIDILTGVLSGGAFGSQVAGLYRDTSQPNDCAHFFLALDTRAFAPDGEFPARLDALAEQVLASGTRPGVDRVMLPGQPESERARAAERDGLLLEPSVLSGLYECAALVGARLPPLPSTDAEREETA